MNKVQKGEVTFVFALLAGLFIYSLLYSPASTTGYVTSSGMSGKSIILIILIAVLALGIIFGLIAFFRKHVKKQDELAGNDNVIHPSLEDLGKKADKKSKSSTNVDKNVKVDDKSKSKKASKKDLDPLDAFIKQAAEEGKSLWEVKHLLAQKGWDLKKIEAYMDANRGLFEKKNPFYYMK